MLSLPIPDSVWADQSITLGGIEYLFTFSFNERDQRWRFNIYLNEEPVILGIKIVEQQFFLENYILPDFDLGDIACIRMKDDGLPVERDNLGQGKSYELIYVANGELEELVRG